MARITRCNGRGQIRHPKDRSRGKANDSETERKGKGEPGSLSRQERASAGRVEEDTEERGLATGNDGGIGLER